MNQHFFNVALLVCFSASIIMADQVKPKIRVKLLRYTLTSNGSGADVVSKVRFTLQTPDGKTFEYPRTSKEWDVKNGESIDLDDEIVISSDFIQGDRTSVRVQLYRDGKEIAPCEITMENLSQYSRTVLCRSDIAAQRKMGRSNDKLVDEAIEMSVKNDAIESPTKEMVASKRGFHLE